MTEDDRKKKYLAHKNEIRKYLTSDEAHKLDIEQQAKLAANRYTLRMWRQKKRIVFKSTLQRMFGYSPKSMISFYREIGLAHVQEARDLREKLLTDSVMRLVKKYGYDYYVPKTGKLTPDIVVKAKKEIAIELKAYRGFYVCGEMEIMQAYKYMKKYGTSWLISTSTKMKHYRGDVQLGTIITNGIQRYRSLKGLRPRTLDDHDMRAIYIKGYRELKMLRERVDPRERIHFFTTEDMDKMMRRNEFKNGIAITDGIELLGLLTRYGILTKDVEYVIKTALSEIIEQIARENANKKKSTNKGEGEDR